MRPIQLGVLAIGVICGSTALAQLMPPVAPLENPTTAERVLLGKVLFWEEQLSADDTVACGTCHQPQAGGSDPRSFLLAARNLGPDGTFGTQDDILGSPGIVSSGCGGTPLDDGVFFPERQVTPRKSPTVIGAAYSPELFWDGRATDAFFDPESGALVIASGAALENQAVQPVLSTVEMSCDGRTWQDVRAKLEVVTPLEFAETLPDDILAALVVYPSYSQLFQQAFGTPELTAARIGMALAAYQRSLIPDATPFDAHLAGDLGALSPQQIAGLDLFDEHCQVCHIGPELTDHDYHNIGLRPNGEDRGRFLVTGDSRDLGKFKTPTLRNVALRAPFFHNGGLATPTLMQTVEFYNNGGDFQDGQSQLIQPLGLAQTEVEAITAFMEALTDPRVRDATPPFDHPRLRPHFRRGDANGDQVVDIGDALTILEFLFLSGSVTCADGADTNDDGLVNLGDPVVLLSRLYQGGLPLPPPSDESTGPDPTRDGLDCAGFE